jgi:cytosine/adenosine deaminase-related metal-dependent hydrolase
MRECAEAREDIMCEVCIANRMSRRRVLAAGISLGAAALTASRVEAQSPLRPVATAGGSQRRDYLIKGAHVVSMDSQIGDLAGADILVRNGEIKAVARNIEAADVEVLDARRMIAIPGLVETHWHMWGTVARNTAGDEEATGYFPYSRVLGGVFTPEDNARGVRLGLAEAINGGLTTVHNWSHNLQSPAFADAELEAHRSFGARALFAYGYSRKTGQNETLPLDEVARVQSAWLPKLDGLVTLGIASRGPENNTIDICQKEWETARRLGMRITTHMGTSVAAFEKRHGVRTLDKAGLLGRDVVLVHNTNTDKADLGLLARTGTHLSLSPFTEMRTGFGIPPILDMLASGCSVSLSVDTLLLCGNCDMFAIMKAMQNVGDGTKPSEFALPARRVLEMATIGGAQALGLADKIGTLTPGKRADIVLLRTRDLNMAPLTDPVRMVVQSAQPSNVDTVLVDGRVLKRDGRLVGIDVDRIVDDATETMTRVQAEVARQNRTIEDVRQQLPTK